MTGISLLYVLMQESKNSATSKTIFFERMPTNISKVKKHINIKIDYEKLPARNEIRLIGRINTSELPSQILNYKWTLKNNLVHKRGSLTGKIDLRQGNEITLDVAIKNMKQKVDVRLEAHAEGTRARITGVQSFSHDPSQDQGTESQELRVQSKTFEQQNLSKEEALQRELYRNRKPSFRQ